MPARIFLPSGAYTSLSSVSSASLICFLLPSIRSWILATATWSVTSSSSSVRRALARVVALIVAAASALTQSLVMILSLNSPTLTKRMMASVIMIAVSASTVAKPAPSRVPSVMFFKTFIAVPLQQGGSARR